jgi:hypothetical protein
MAKPKRGRHIKSIPNWRGTCPKCERTGVKLLWIKLEKDNEQLNVCKRCGK